MFDFRCRTCGHLFEGFVFSRDQAREVCCNTCGAGTEIVWLPQSGPHVVADSIPGGLLIENLHSQPKRYYSRSELKRDMDAKGVEHRVRHVGAPGSDKSIHTQRWI